MEFVIVIENTDNWLGLGTMSDGIAGKQQTLVDSRRNMVYILIKSGLVDLHVRSDWARAELCCRNFLIFINSRESTFIGFEKIIFNQPSIENDFQVDFKPQTCCYLLLRQFILNSLFSPPDTRFLTKGKCESKIHDRSLPRLSVPNAKAGQNKLEAPYADC